VTNRPSVRVPQRAMPAMNFLASLDAQTRDAMVGILNEKPVTTSLQALRERLSDLLNSAPVPTKMAREVVAEFFGLASAANDHDWDFKAVAEVVSETEGLEIGAGTREEFADFLYRCLSSVAVKTLGKATDLAHEHPKRMHTARIITDLTPIFDSPEQEPLGGLVMHRLRIDCFTSNRADEVLEIALTTSQLAELSDTIVRAQKKAASLDQVLGRLSLSAFSTSEDH
jgi:hypothetical protein